MTNKKKAFSTVLASTAFFSCLIFLSSTALAITTSNENGMAIISDKIPVSPEAPIQAQPTIELQTSYLYDSLMAGKEYEYRIEIKNIASKEITIDPKLTDYYSDSEQAFGNDAIKISAPSILKAGEVTYLTINVNVPENATGNYYGSIGMNVDEKENDGSSPQLSLSFYVWKQPEVPYSKSFSTKTNAPITIEVSTDTYDLGMGLRNSSIREKPSFRLRLAHDSYPVNMTFVKSVESGSINLGGYYPYLSAKSDNYYQNSNEHYVETYFVPGEIGNWELNILPKNTNNFGYSITLGDNNSALTGTTTPDNATVNNTIQANATVETTQVLMLESFPVQVHLIAQGYLPDSCTEIDNIKIERDENNFNINIITKRPKDSICTQVIVPFNETIPLDVQGLKAGNYTVNVNGVKGSFELASDNILSEQPGLTPPKQQEINETDNGKNISLKNGESFYLKLKENPSTGYSWQLNLSHGFSILSENYTQDPAPPGYVGVPGTHLWEIKAITQDSQQVKGIYKQPWKETTGTEDKFTLNVEVI
jgi:inhibitor of cysteine peptidase